MVSFVSDPVVMSKSKAKTLFECLPSYNEGYLEVSGGHSIYYEEYGNPKGKPVLFLHGGPGAGFSSFFKKSSIKLLDLLIVSNQD